MSRIKTPQPLLGQRIKAVRKAAKPKVTLEDLEGPIGISNPALSMIERGERNPSESTLILLAQYFGADFGEGWLRPYVQSSAVVAGALHYLNALPAEGQAEALKMLTDLHKKYVGPNTGTEHRTKRLIAENYRAHPQKNKEKTSKRK